MIFTDNINPQGKQYLEDAQSVFNDYLSPQAVQIDIELLDNLKTIIKQTNIIEISKTWKYDQQWSWFQSNPKWLNEISDLFGAINKFLIQKSTSKQGLEPIGDLARGHLDNLFPKYYQAFIFGIFLRMSYFPSQVLGKDYSSVPWKSSLYDQALQLVEKFNSLFKIADPNSMDAILKTCEKIQTEWKSLLSNYFHELFRLDNDWIAEKSSYLADEYPMTLEQLQAVKANPLSLEKEMCLPPRADIILIAAGSSARTDQQYPLYIQKLAKTHPHKKIKIFMIDPFFITRHPKSMTSDWTAIDDNGEEVKYSNRFTKGNVEAIICREGFTCTDYEFKLIKSFLSAALQSGAQIFLGNHCSNVADYLPKLFNQLKEQYPAPNQLILYSEHGDGIVDVWKDSLYNRKTCDILELEQKSKLKPRKDFETQLRKMESLSEAEIQEIVANYRQGKLALDYELKSSMDDLSF